MRTSAALLSVALCALSAGLPACAVGAGSANEVSTVVCTSTQGFHDGDTFACLPESGGQAFVIRVAGIDAPETGQAYWRSTRDELRHLARAGTRVGCFKNDRYERRVCRVWTPDGSDVGEALLRAGLAWHYVAYAGDQAAEERQRYASTEAAARGMKAGLWAQPEPQAPWECRRARMGREKCR